jgi:histidine ammonia-lyase
MGASAATKCLRVIQNVEKVLAIELLTAVQALEFRRPLRSSPQIEATAAAFREEVSFNDADRVLNDDMLKAIEFIKINPSSS